MTKALPYNYAQRRVAHSTSDLRELVRSALHDILSNSARDTPEQPLHFRQSPDWSELKAADSVTNKSGIEFIFRACTERRSDDWFLARPPLIDPEIPHHAQYIVFTPPKEEHVELVLERVIRVKNLLI